MASSQRPVIPGERVSSRSKKPVNYYTLHHYGYQNTAHFGLDASRAVDSDPPANSRKRKSNPSSTRASEPLKRPAIEPEPEAASRGHRDPAIRTGRAAPNAASKGATLKRKGAGRARKSAMATITEMTGSPPSGLEAQNLALDPDGHRAPMVTSHPTPALDAPTRRSISRPPKKRATERSRPSFRRWQNAPEQHLPLLPPTPTQVKDPVNQVDTPSIEHPSTMESIMGKFPAEQQLPTPHSLQATSPTISATEIAVPSSDNGDRTLTSMVGAAHMTVQDLTRPNAPTDSESTREPLPIPEHSTAQGTESWSRPIDLISSDDLSGAPEGLPDTEAHAMKKYSMEVDNPCPTSSTAAVDDESNLPSPVWPTSVTSHSGAPVQHIETTPQPVLDQTAFVSTRSRRAIKPVQRFGELVATDEALAAFAEEEHDDQHIAVGVSYFQDSTELDYDHKEMDVDYEVPVNDEDNVSEPDSAAEAPASVRQCRPRIQQRPTTRTRIVTLRLPPESAIGSAKTASVMRKPLRTYPPFSEMDAALHQVPVTPTAVDETNLDPELLRLSKKLSHRQPLGLKPKTSGRPEVWADSRQALCETLPYFRMPQSGCHQKDRHVYAFLFDAAGHCREYMDSDVVISRAGGSMEHDGTGQMLQKKDHLMTEAQVQSVLNNIEHQNPLVIIAGNRNERAICRLPHRYSVLGWYKPVAVWAEKTMGKGGKVCTTIKYRFERLDPTTAAWHAPARRQLTEEEHTSIGPLTFQVCAQCSNRYPVMYLHGWMCLNSDCDQFWKLSSGQDAPYDKLHYNPAFLLTRTRWGNEQEPFSVRPPIPDVGHNVGDNLTYVNTRGICCPKCGRCSSRRLFKGWLCDNPKCTYQNFPKHIPVKASMLHCPWDSVGDNIGGGPSFAKNKHEKEQGVTVTVSHKLGFKIYTYTFKGVGGKLVHAVSNSAINRQPRGPDEMFAAMQRQDDPDMDLHLERRRFNGKPILCADPSFSAAFARIWDDDQRRASGLEALRRESFLAQLAGSSATISEAKVSSDVSRQPQEAAEAQTVDDRSEAADYGDYMTSFSINYGMPYKFVASAASLPFTNAPWPIRACQADLNWASKNFLDPTGHQELNELLVFAYLQGQKIEYHDDGESGLGPRISTLSLGGKAKMHLRMKQKHYIGCSKTGVFNAERPVPGSVDGDTMYQKRLGSWNSLQSLDLASKAGKSLYERRRKEIPKELGIYEKRSKKASDLVTVTLSHGDIVLMEGYEIQQYLEHKVVPEGCLRFALTCRTVLPDHLKPEERPGYEVGPHDPTISSLYRMDDEERRKRAESIAA